MNPYRWELSDGSEVQLSLSTNIDNILQKYKGGKVVEGVFLMDCGIVPAMPFILRYCFEQDVNLRERQFLRELPSPTTCKIDKPRIKSDFKRPLRSDFGPVRSIDGNLVICPSGRFSNGKILFPPEDVAHLVEGIIRNLDYGGAYTHPIRCIQTVKYYHECLDAGLLK